MASFQDPSSGYVVIWDEEDAPGRRGGIVVDAYPQDFEEALAEARAVDPEADEAALRECLESAQALADRMTGYYASWEDAADYFVHVLRIPRDDL